VPGVEDAADEAYALLVQQMAQAGAAGAMSMDVIVQRLLSSGSTPAEVEAILLADIEAEGRIFGDFLKGIRQQFDGGIKWTQERTEFAAWDKQAQKMGYASAEEMRQVWILVSDNPCPDCIDRSGMGALPRSEWVAMGLPGEGTTICGPRCHCHMATVPPDSDGSEVNRAAGGAISPKAAKIMAEAKRKGQEQ